MSPSSPIPVQPAVFNTDDAARYLGRSPGTLIAWRCSREVDIPFVRLGRCVVYRKADLDAYLAAHLEGGQSS